MNLCYKLKKELYLAAFCTLLASVSALAQSFYDARRDRQYIAAIGTGTTSYFGDLNNPKDIFDTKLNLNLSLQKFYAERISARVGLTWFQLKGTDAEANVDGRVRRNLSFVGQNFELNLEGLAYLFPRPSRFYRRKSFNVYAIAGIGVAYYIPRAEVPELDNNGAPLSKGGKKTALRKLETEGARYGIMTLVLPLGGGLKYKINPYFNVALEGAHRKTFTDYLDDVSSTYVAQESFGEDALAASMADRRPQIDLPVRPEGSTRGDPTDKDAYFIWNIKVEYFLPSVGIFAPKGSYNRKRTKPIKRRKGYSGSRRRR